MSSHSSHHPQEVLPVQIYVHKCGLNPLSFHFHFSRAKCQFSCLSFRCARGGLRVQSVSTNKCQVGLCCQCVRGGRRVHSRSPRSQFLYSQVPCRFELSVCTRRSPLELSDTLDKQTTPISNDNCQRYHRQTLPIGKHTRDRELI